MGAKKRAKPGTSTRRGGRPARAGEAAATFALRLTATERARLEAAAERAGKSLAVFIRDAALSYCD